MGIETKIVKAEEVGNHPIVGTLDVTVEVSSINTKGDVIKSCKINVRVNSKVTIVANQSLAQQLPGEYINRAKAAAKKYFLENSV